MGLIDKEKLKQELDFKSFNEEYTISGGLWIKYSVVEETINKQPEQPERKEGYMSETGNPISKEKMRIVIDNYFKTECDVNTSIREAFEKGFRIGVQKGQCTKHAPATGQCMHVDEEAE